MVDVKKRLSGGCEEKTCDILFSLLILPTAKKYNELFPKERKEKKKKEEQPKKQQPPKQQPKKQEQPKEEEEEEEEDKPKPPKFKDPYIDLPKRYLL